MGCDNRFLAHIFGKKENEDQDGQAQHMNAENFRVH